MFGVIDRLERVRLAEAEFIFRRGPPVLACECDEPRERRDLGDILARLVRELRMGSSGSSSFRRLEKMNASL